MTARSFVVSLVTLIAVACASAPPAKHSIDVVGTPADRRQLAGNWRGAFETPNHTHDGTIQFEIDPEGLAGDGAVVLTAQNTNLRVIYVRVTGSTVAGAIEPYYDEVCKCTVYSTFAGKLEGSGIRGEFQMKPRMGSPIIGSWSVVK